MLEGFVMNRLGRELVEFQNDRKRVADNFAKLEEFVVKHGIEKTIDIIREEMKGSNQIYKAHLDLALESCLKNTL